MGGEWPLTGVPHSFGVGSPSAEKCEQIVDIVAVRANSGFLNFSSSMVLGPMYCGYPSARIWARTRALSRSPTSFMRSAMNFLIEARRTATELHFLAAWQKLAFINDSLLFNDSVYVRQ